MRNSEREAIINSVKTNASVKRYARASAVVLHALTILFLTAYLLPSDAFAQMHSIPSDNKRVDNSMPADLQNVGIDQRLNAQLPLDTILRDELGNDVPLRTYFGKKPVLVAFVYYQCPMLCNEVLNGTLGSLKALDFTAGKEFDVVAISFDARENEMRGLANEKKQSYVDRYNRAGAKEGWHFLTGTEESIKRVTEAAGFHFQFDEQANQFAHAAGIMIATPDGRLARYFYGIEFPPKDVRLGLIEAADGKIGSPVDKLLLYCFHYDPATGTYSAAILNIMRAAGVAVLIAFALFYFFIRRYHPSSQGGDARAAGGTI